MASRRSGKKRRNTGRKAGRNSAAARASKRAQGGSRAKRLAVYAVLLALAAGVAGIAWTDHVVVREFEARRFDMPAQVFAQPLELYVGAALDQDRLVGRLVRLGYTQTADASVPGSYARGNGTLLVHTRPFAFWDGLRPARRLRVEFTSGAVSGLTALSGEQLDLARLEPQLVGSLLAANGEDRIALANGELPTMLRDALLTAEDRRFYEHAGIDWVGIGRAAWVNLRAGEVRQGGSTLTQQLVKSFFLSNERTYRRKLIEVVMALVLEARYDKSTLLNAYSNEVYLGQDGGRAIHGFGLASQFLFGKPVNELQLHQTALLVALVRGPSLYAPRRHPERALERRNLVLSLMAEQGVIDASMANRASAQPLGVTPTPARGAAFYPAYMDLVRQQLSAGYDARQLTRAGLRIFTALDPDIQTAAERSLAAELAALPADAPLQGAMMVTSTDGGEVLAVVGGRNTAFDGFNRALDARRPMGSLIKPVLYLAAIESGRYHLATALDNSAVTVALPGAKVWQPGNFDGTEGEPVPLFRALSESVNLPAVHTALAIGPDQVADTLWKLGARQAIQKGAAGYPSIALGAVDVSVSEVAQVYNTLANSGFYTPLRAVLAVVDADGVPLQRFGLQLETVADAVSVSQIKAAMIETMRSGTGRSVRVQLGSDVAVAGKTGTTNDFRDSWFAGFTDDMLAVVWIGNDDNRSTGLTGAAGALRVWSAFMRTQPLNPVQVLQAQELEARWVDRATGQLSDPSCGAAVQLLLPAGAAIESLPGCRVEGAADARPGFATRTLNWLKDRFRR